MSKSGKKSDQGKISNRRARFDYELGDSLLVGIQLTGAETKALRFGHGQLRGAYVMVKNSELWLVGARINSSQGVPITESEQLRSRKLLAHSKEIGKLIESRQEGNSIVPLELLTAGRYIKLRIAVGKGKKRYDKRETLKRRQQERDIARRARV
ncbi:SsrA-binding protein SmpB [Candidatus Saccharibacteria bacterium]|nr:SsrA-binding protein SmpB [Candidatus Saccharibacteria bacterium]